MRDLPYARSALRVSGDYCLVSLLAFIVPSPRADDPAGLTALRVGDPEVIVAEEVQGAKAGLALQLHLDAVRLSSVSRKAPSKIRADPGSPPVVFEVASSFWFVPLEVHFVWYPNVDTKLVSALG